MRSRSAFSADDRAGELQVALCADDYGIAPGVGVAVRDLLARCRLSATSCMAASPHWPEEAAKLKALAGGDGSFEVGLHLTLTDQAPLGAMPRTAPRGRLPSLPRLLGLAVSRTLDAAEVAAEMERQLDAFEAAWGGPPAFVDGHQHAHQLPVIRRA
ncbi:MAG: ChbG/HpnK family deacetylase, partial [Rhodospirillales bacterium]|nr:ChbG/HpnK family deacetylase [Rhodospirillales bacterium]